MKAHQGELGFGDADAPGRKRRSHDDTNLECAQIILADRAKYDNPDSAFLIRWAEAVVRRLERPY